MGMPRKLLAWLMVPVICLFALVLYVARPFNPDNNRLLARTIARVGRLLLGMERPLEGADNMPQDRPTVVIANHQHNDDLFVMGDLLPPRTVTVGKSSLIWIPFFGQVFWLGGNVILNRGRSHKAVAVMQATSEAISRDRKSSGSFQRVPAAAAGACNHSRKGLFTPPLPPVRPSPWSAPASTMIVPWGGPVAANRWLSGCFRRLKPQDSRLRIFPS